MKFYCVMAEFYEDRYSRINAAVDSRICKEKPKNQYKQKYGMKAFKIWLTSESKAQELCEEIRTGDTGIDTLIGLCADTKECEQKRVA